MKQNYFIFIKKVNEEKESLIFVGLIGECEDSKEALNRYIENITDEDRKFLEDNLNENKDNNQLLIIPEDSDIVKLVIDELIKEIEVTEPNSEILKIMTECKSKH